MFLVISGSFKFSAISTVLKPGFLLNKLKIDNPRLLIGSLIGPLITSFIASSIWSLFGLYLVIYLVILIFMDSTSSNLKNLSLINLVIIGFNTSNKKIYTYICIQKSVLIKSNNGGNKNISVAEMLKYIAIQNIIYFKVCLIIRITPYYVIPYPISLLHHF